MIDLFNIIRRLKKTGIYYEIKSFRDDYIMLVVSVPGERWEIELSSQGFIEIEIFRSDGNIFDENKLEELFSKYSN
jgi:hypothetical protein